MFENTVGVILGPIMNLPEPFGLLVISFLLTAVMTLVYKFMTDQKMMKELKDELKLLQKEMKELKDNPTKMMEVQKKAMEKNMKYMMHSMKPTIITFLPIIVIFSWLRNYYTAIGNPKIFFGLSWIWTYIIFSFALGLLLRKLLKVY